MAKKLPREVAALEALKRGRYEYERGWKAELSAYRHGDSITGNRYRKTAENWFAKAEAHFDAVHEFLKDEVHGRPSDEPE